MGRGGRVGGLRRWWWEGGGDRSLCERLVLVLRGLSAVRGLAWAARGRGGGTDQTVLDLVTGRVERARGSLDLLGELAWGVGSVGSYGKGLDGGVVREDEGEGVEG